MSEGKRSEAGAEKDRKIGDSTDLPGDSETTFQGFDVSGGTKELPKEEKTWNASVGTEFDLPSSMAQRESPRMIVLRKRLVHLAILKVLKDAQSPIKGFEIKTKMGIDMEGVAAGLRTLFYAGHIRLDPDTHTLGYIITEDGKKHFEMLDKIF